MSDPGARLAPIARGASRGLVAAMAMTGMRRVTSGLGWLERTPPEEIIGEEAPGVLRRLSPGRAQAAVEVAHWLYGTGGGAVFGLLPERVRRSRLVGPVYGIAFWLLFELVVAPVVGVRSAERKSVVSRLTLAGDHILYGTVVAANAPRSGRPHR